MTVAGAGALPHAGSRWPLVGRDRELELIAGALADDALAGVVIAGPPGVGKSRVAAEALAAVRGRGSPVAWAAGTRSAATIPFGALAQLLPRPGAAATSQLDYLQRAARALAAGSGGGDRTLVLAIDDAQWLDDGSAALVHQVAMMRGARVLATLRSDTPAPDAIVTLWTGGHAARVDLAPLPRADIERLAATALGGELAGPAAFALWKATNGNPLLLRELMLDALEHGRLAPLDGVWRLREPLAAGARTVALIEERLGRLGAAERTALETVALGEPLALDLAERLVGAELLARLDAHGLLRLEARGDGVQVRLAHPLHAEALNAGLSPLQRRDAQRRLADALAAAEPDGGPDLLRIAVWRLDSGSPPDPELCLRAAGLALALFEPELARRLAAAAGDGFAARHLHAMALLVGGAVPEALAALEALQTSASGDAERAAAADGLATALCWVAGDAERAEAVALRAQEAISDAGARDALIALRATIAAFQGRPANTLALAEPLLERRAPDDPIGGRAALAVVSAAASAGRAERTAAVVERWLPAVERLSATIPLARSQLLAGHALALMLSGRLREARELAEAGYRESLDGGARESTAMWALTCGRSDLLAGALERAGRRLRESAALLGEIDTIGWLPWTLACLGHLAALEGDHEAAAAALERSAGLSRPAMELYAPDVELAHAWALAARGERSAARMRTLAATERATVRGQHGFAVLAAHQLARLGDPVAAARRLDVLLALVDGPLAPACAAHAAALRGADGAALDRVATSFATIGAGLFAAEAAAEAAEAHRAAGDAGRARASERRSRRLAASFPQARTPPLATGAREDPLTRREREVAHLAAGGLTSRQVAERLGLSIRTVENHLQHVYRKLGVTGRDRLREALGAE